MPLNTQNAKPHPSGSDTVSGDTLQGDARYLIHQGKTEIREGYRLGDPQRILAQYSSEFTDLSEGWPSFGGAEAKAVLLARLEALFASSDLRLVPLIMDVLLFGSSALAFGWHELEIAPRDGSAARIRRTRFVELWSRESDGQWRISLFLDNTDQPSAFADQVIAAIGAGGVAPPSGGSSAELAGKPGHEPVAVP